MATTERQHACPPSTNRQHGEASGHTPTAARTGRPATEAPRQRPCTARENGLTNSNPPPPVAQRFQRRTTSPTPRQRPHNPSSPPGTCGGSVHRRRTLAEIPHLTIRTASLICVLNTLMPCPFKLQNRCNRYQIRGKLRPDIPVDGRMPVGPWLERIAATLPSGFSPPTLRCGWLETPW